MQAFLLTLLFVSVAFAQFPSNVTVPYKYPLFKQCNSSWGNDIMVTTTICKVGCLMSSVSMALNGHKILIEGKESNPGVLNHWLRNNGGYTSNDELEETALPKINPHRVIWTGPASGLHPAQVKKMLDEKTHVVIANVNAGHHFVLVVGYDHGETNFYVNDPGFNKLYYTMGEIVGWRLFQMKDIVGDVQPQT